MPHNPTQTPICSPKKLEGMKEATNIVEKMAFDVEHNTETNCKCLSACSTYNYPFEISIGKIAKDEVMQIDKNKLSK